MFSVAKIRNKEGHFSAYGSFLVGFKRPLYSASEDLYNAALAIDILGPEPAVRDMVRWAKRGEFFWVQPLERNPLGQRPAGFYVRAAAGRVLTVKPRPGYLHALLLDERLLRGNVAWEEDSENVLFRFLDRNLNIPLPREWMDYLLGKVNAQKEVVRKVEVYTGNHPVTPWEIVSRRELQAKAEDVLSKGLKSGEIKFPGFNGSVATDPLSGISGLEDYLTKFGNLLGDKIAQKHKPLHDPADPDSPLIHDLLRKPYKAQADAIQGLAKAFQRRKSLFLVGEMGVGKTLIAVAVPYLLFDRPYRVLVVCPPHLVNKWVREINQTVPGAEAVVITDWKEALKAWRQPFAKPGNRQYFVVSRETMKLGYSRRFAGLYSPQKMVKGQKAKDAWVCPQCGSLLWSDDPKAPQTPGKTTRVCQKCGSPLWTADRKLRKVSVAQIIKRLPAGFFDLAVVDEVHEMKGENTAQGEAFGLIAGKAKKVLALTGTLIGGYASDIFYLLWRTDPAHMVKEGYTWHKVGEFIDEYGIREVEKRYNARGTKTYERNRPGINPALFSRHLLESAAFLSLSDLSADLPPFTETVKIVEMDPSLREAYASAEADVRKALGSGSVVKPGYLNALMAYVDRPWGHPAITNSEGKAMITFPDLPQHVVRPKEKALVDVIKAERAEGRKVFVYLVYTDTKDVAGRLQEVLIWEGIRAEVLRASVAPVEREAWLKSKAQDADVVLGNMNLVKTGLDLYDFPTLVFYQTGYQLFSLRQASRRSWRIGQTRPVRVVYMAYKDTIQDAGLRLMGSKLRAAMSLEGKFSAEGLWAMAEGIDITSELARRLMEGLDGVETAEEIWRPFRESTAPVPLIPVVVRRARRKRIVQPAAVGQLAWDFGEA